MPVPEATIEDTVGAPHRVKVREAVPVLPAASVSLATSVCAPLVRPAGVNDQAPLAFAVVVPRMVAPSLIVTVALASPAPLSVALEVMLSLEEEPVSLSNPAVTAGAAVSTVTLSAVEAAGVAGRHPSPSGCASH